MVVKFFKSEPGRYSIILMVWLLGYILPDLAMTYTAWYGEWFHPLQAIVPLILIYCTYALTQARWREELGMILILQIVMNLGDVILDAPWQDYDRYQAILNGLELLILIGWGLPDLLYRTYRERRNSRADKPVDNRADSRHGLAKNGEGISGHVG